MTIPKEKEEHLSWRITEIADSHWCPSCGHSDMSKIGGTRIQCKECSTILDVVFLDDEYRTFNVSIVRSADCQMFSEVVNHVLHNLPRRVIEEMITSYISATNITLEANDQSSDQSEVEKLIDLTTNFFHSLETDPSRNKVT